MLLMTGLKFSTGLVTVGAGPMRREISIYIHSRAALFVVQQNFGSETALSKLSLLSSPPEKYSAWEMVKGDVEVARHSHFTNLLKSPS